MKHIILTASIFLISVAGFGQNTKTLKAFYLEYDTDSEMFAFEEPDGGYFGFNYASADVLAKFPLKSTRV